MTYADKLKALVWIKGYTDAEIALALSEVGFLGTDVYSSDYESLVVQAAINVLSGMLSNIKSVSEGGYSVTYSTEGITFRLNYLSRKFGVEIPGQPILKFIRRW